MGFPGGSVVKNPPAGDACCSRGHRCADMQARSGWMHKTDLGSTSKLCDLGLTTLGFQPPLHLAGLTSFPLAPCPHAFWGPSWFLAQGHQKQSPEVLNLAAHSITGRA